MKTSLLVTQARARVALHQHQALLGQRRHQSRGAVACLPCSQGCVPNRLRGYTSALGLRSLGWCDRRTTARPFIQSRGTKGCSLLVEALLVVAGQHGTIVGTGDRSRPGSQFTQARQILVPGVIIRHGNACPIRPNQGVDPVSMRPSLLAVHNLGELLPLKAELAFELGPELRPRLFGPVLLRVYMHMVERRCMPGMCYYIGQFLDLIMYASPDQPT